MFEIRVDHHRQLIALRIWGFWDAETARSFAAQHLETVGSLGLPAGTHRVIAHFEGFAVQSEETVSIMQRLIVSNKARRIALVALSALSRAQAMRTLVTPNIRLFDTVAEAEAWLFATGREAVQPRIPC